MHSLAYFKDPTLCTRNTNLSNNKSLQASIKAVYSEKICIVKSKRSRKRLTKWFAAFKTSTNWDKIKRRERREAGLMLEQEAKRKEMNTLAPVVWQNCVENKRFKWPVWIKGEKRRMSLKYKEKIPIETMGKKGQGCFVNKCCSIYQRSYKGRCWIFSKSPWNMIMQRPHTIGKSHTRQTQWPPITRSFRYFLNIVPAKKTSTNNV